MFGDDLDQTIVIIGGILIGVTALLFCLAWLEETLKPKPQPRQVRSTHRSSDPAGPCSPLPREASHIGATPPILSVPALQRLPFTIQPP